MIKEWSTRSVKLIKETKLINGARWKRANHGFFSKISGQDLKWRPTTQRTYRQSWYYLALASYSFVITINPPFFTVHVTHSWRRLINQILVYYETVNTCRALAVSSRLCTYLYIFLTHSCLKCLFFYLFIHKLIIKLLHHHFASILWPFPQIWIRNSPQSSFLPFFSLYFVFKIVFPALHF